MSGPAYTTRLSERSDVELEMMRFTHEWSMHWDYQPMSAIPIWYHAQFMMFL